MSATSARAAAGAWLSLAALLAGCAPAPAAAPATPPVPAPAGAGAAGDAASAIRVNHLGYLPQGPKVAVICARDGILPATFEVRNASGARVLGPLPVTRDGAIAACAATARLDFTAVKDEGSYRLVAGAMTPVTVTVSRTAWAGAADTLLAYMRQQRSRFNPYLRDSVHHRTDALIVDHARAGEFIDVAGGWADAADYLQYVTTSAHATYAMLAAGRDFPRVFGDTHDHDGLPGANGLIDVLDEARWGLEWLLRMHPSDDLIFNQIADDRDHAFHDLPNTDSSDYGWGKGGFRPVYPCTGRPQGLFAGKNRADGYASTAGKMAAAFALGVRVFRDRDPAFAQVLATKARSAYALGRKYPGACQTAPGRSPYFYEEASWVDDMELGAAELHALTGEAHFLQEAVEYAEQEPVTPWMGRDTARHYEYYPWVNHGHRAVWQEAADAATKARMVEFYRRGLQAVTDRAQNGFRNGIPFIWCSNNLLASFATQGVLFRRMGGGEAFRGPEQAAMDWIFGANPWGTSMVVYFPVTADYPANPHSNMAYDLGVQAQMGGLTDGPVYASIYRSLEGISLVEPDEYAVWNTGNIVYHDDYGDYSTNEPIMDGTAVLIYVVAAYADMALR
ncbi:MAG: glycoside hydrolase [Gemmatimonadetes bacterium]|nr:glycoside hydrolase [Gemmatimonadota bacterium]